MHEKELYFVEVYPIQNLSVIWRRHHYWCVTTHFEELRTSKMIFRVRYIWDQVNAFWKKRNKSALLSAILTHFEQFRKRHFAWLALFVLFQKCSHNFYLYDRRSGGKLFLSCLSLCPPLWNFNLANNFWTVSARALIFHMSISCDETFPLVPLFLTLRPWPWSFTHFLKTLNY